MLSVAHHIQMQTAEYSATRLMPTILLSAPVLAGFPKIRVMLWVESRPRYKYFFICFAKVMH
jgi:hypothetical protein